MLFSINVSPASTSGPANSLELVSETRTSKCHNFRWPIDKDKPVERLWKDAETYCLNNYFDDLQSRHLAFRNLKDEHGSDLPVHFRLGDLFPDVSEPTKLQLTYTWLDRPCSLPASSPLLPLRLRRPRDLDESDRRRNPVQSDSNSDEVFQSMEDDNIDNADDNSNEDDSGRHTDAAQNHAARQVSQRPSHSSRDSRVADARRRTNDGFAIPPLPRRLNNVIRPQNPSPLNQVHSSSHMSEQPEAPPSRLHSSQYEDIEVPETDIEDSRPLQSLRRAPVEHHPSLQESSRLPPSPSASTEQSKKDARPTHKPMTSEKVFQLMIERRKGRCEPTDLQKNPKSTPSEKSPNHGEANNRIRAGDAGGAGDQGDQGDQGDSGNRVESLDRVVSGDANISSAGKKRRPSNSVEQRANKTVKNSGKTRDRKGKGKKIQPARSVPKVSRTSKAKTNRPTYDVGESHSMLPRAPAQSVGGHAQDPIFIVDDDNDIVMGQDGTVEASQESSSVEQNDINQTATKNALSQREVSDQLINSAANAEKRKQAAEYFTTYGDDEALSVSEPTTELRSSADKALPISSTTNRTAASKGKGKQAMQESMAAFLSRKAPPKSHFSNQHPYQNQLSDDIEDPSSAEFEQTRPQIAPKSVPLVSMSSRPSTRILPIPSRTNVQSEQTASNSKESSVSITKPTIASAPQASGNLAEKTTPALIRKGGQGEARLDPQSSRNFHLPSEPSTSASIPKCTDTVASSIAGKAPRPMSSQPDAVASSTNPQSTPTVGNEPASASRTSLHHRIACPSQSRGTLTKLSGENLGLKQAQLKYRNSRQMPRARETGIQLDHEINPRSTALGPQDLAKVQNTPRPQLSASSGSSSTSEPSSRSESAGPPSTQRRMGSSAKIAAAKAQAQAAEDAVSAFSADASTSYRDSAVREDPDEGFGHDALEDEVEEDSEISELSDENDVNVNGFVEKGKTPRIQDPTNVQSEANPPASTLQSRGVERYSASGKLVPNEMPNRLANKSDTVDAARDPSTSAQPGPSQSRPSMNTSMQNSTGSLRRQTEPSQKPDKQRPNWRNRRSRSQSLSITSLSSHESDSESTKVAVRNMKAKEACTEDEKDARWSKMLSIECKPKFSFLNVFGSSQPQPQAEPQSDESRKTWFNVGGS